MILRISARISRHRLTDARFGTEFNFAVLIAAASIPGLLLLWLLPGPLVLPALSLALLIIGAVLLLSAFIAGAGRHGRGLTLWDAAGACVFLGCAAGMLSKPESVLQLFGLTPMS